MRITKAYALRKPVIWLVLFLVVTACNSVKTSIPTMDTVSTQLITVMPSVKPSGIRETITAEVRTQAPLGITPTAVPTSTEAFSFPTLTATMTPYRTPLPGEIITSPDEHCQIVPVPELIDQNDLADGIHLAGVFYLCWGWLSPLDHRTSFDLDTGFVGREEDAGTDIEFSILTPTIDSSSDELHFIGINGASFIEITLDAPNLNECLMAFATKEPKTFSITEELSACWITSENRSAYVWVERVNPFGQGSIAISFVTWEK